MHSAEWNWQRAFTLIELLITLVILGALLSVAVPTYQEYVERARRTKAIKDIAEISLAIERHLSQTGTYPNNPSDLGELNPAPPSEDPWGHAYQYLGIDVVPRPNQGAVRKDKNLNPLNSDYDLYSMGPDGQTQKQLTAAKARDDVVRAGNGGFIGLASEH